MDPTNLVSILSLIANLGTNAPTLVVSNNEVRPLVYAEQRATTNWMNFSRAVQIDEFGNKSIKKWLHSVTDQTVRYEVTPRIVWDTNPVVIKSSTLILFDYPTNAPWKWVPAPPGVPGHDQPPMPNLQTGKQ